MMRSAQTFSFCFALFSLVAIRVEAQDISLLGGDLTSSLAPNAALELPAPNIRSEEAFQTHLLSHGDFHVAFDQQNGNGAKIVGPNFNHVSCGGCHVKNGRGAVKFSRTEEEGSPMLIKVSLRGLNRDGSPKNIPGVGEQLQDHSVNGKIRFDIKLAWKAVTGTYGDGTKYTLRRPSLSFNIPGVDEKRVVSSLRLTPTVIGMGLLEAVPDWFVEFMADPTDADRDGISGRVSYVINHETNLQAIGRFGFKASHPTIKQQSAAALFNDMGLTNEIFQDARQGQEVSAEVMDRLVFYLRAAGVTPQRTPDDPDVVAGKALFQTLNCSGCHKMTLFTQDSPAIETANQTFHPFTDLLLHDMGPGLADERAEFSARGSEWRTTPLWGLGLVKVLSRNRPGYLHDGRARTVEEAILWHGGEAKRSTSRFKSLSRTKRRQLVAFLNSL